MSLNPKNGLDPDNIKLRSSLGLESIEYPVQVCMFREHAYPLSCTSFLYRYMPLYYQPHRYIYTTDAPAMQGYWVFGRLVEALADVGYDSNNLVSANYDWCVPLVAKGVTGCH